MVISSPTISCSSREHVVLGAGDHAHVDERLCPLRDDVVLVPGGEHGRIRGGAERGAQERLGGAGGRGQSIRIVHRPAAQGAEPVQQRLGGRGEPDRPAGASDRRDGLGELGDGVVVVQPAAVPRAPLGDQADPDERLLADLQKIGASVIDRDRVPADLADRLGRSGEPLRVGSGRRAPSPRPRRSPRRRRRRAPDRVPAAPRPGGCRRPR